MTGATWSGKSKWGPYVPSIPGERATVQKLFAVTRVQARRDVPGRGRGDGQEADGGAASREGRAAMHERIEEEDNLTKVLLKVQWMEEKERSVELLN